MSEISDKQLTHVQASDWMTLARLSPTGTDSSVHDVFYPPVTKSNRLGSHDDQQRHSRAPDFLTALTDDQYDRAYNYILQVERGDLVDIHSLLKSVKREGKVISSVLSHVVWWLNQNPTVPRDRDNNKPSLRLDFLPLLRERHAELADEVSVRLERDVILYM